MLKFHRIQLKYVTFLEDSIFKEFYQKERYSFYNFLEYLPFVVHFYLKIYLIKSVKYVYSHKPKLIIAKNEMEKK